MKREDLLIILLCVGAWAAFLYIIIAEFGW